LFCRPSAWSSADSIATDVLASTADLRVEMTMMRSARSAFIFASSCTACSVLYSSKNTASALLMAASRAAVSSGTTDSQAADSSESAATCLSMKRRDLAPSMKSPWRPQAAAVEMAASSGLISPPLTAASTALAASNRSCLSSLNRSSVSRALCMSSSPCSPPSSSACFTAPSRREISSTVAADKAVERAELARCVRKDESSSRAARITGTASSDKLVCPSAVCEARRGRPSRSSKAASNDSTLGSATARSRASRAALRAIFAEMRAFRWALQSETNAC